MWVTKLSESKMIHLVKTLVPVRTAFEDLPPLAEFYFSEVLYIFTF